MQTAISIFKGDDGLRWAVLISSNAYEDRDQEIVSQKALERYVAQFEPGSPVLFWHGGHPIGAVKYAEMAGPFLVELAQELPDKVIDLSKAGETPFLVHRRDVWDALEAHRGEWGVSIGFGAQRGDEDDSVFEDVQIFERSILPREDAANWFTYAAL